MVIKYNHTGVKGIGSIKLLPGVNFGVDEKEWKKWEKNPIIQAEIEEGTIEVMHEGGTQEKISIAKMKVNEAKELIKSTTSVELLEHFQSETSNKTLLKAIDAQIEEIKAPVEFRDRGEESK